MAQAAQRRRLAQKSDDVSPLYKTKPDASQRTPSPETMGRSSFSSVREGDSDLAQTFSTSKVSSYSAVPEEAVDDVPASHPMATAQFAAPLTQPSSRLHGYWYPPETAFKGWKGIDVRGKLASKSFGDLQALNVGWESEIGAHHVKGQGKKAATKESTRNVGESVMETLPNEVYGMILGYLVLDVPPPNGVERRNIDLMSVLMTSKTMFNKTLSTLYSRVTIPHSRIFQKFLSQVSAYPYFGEFVRRLDFSHFNPSTLFSTGSERAQARNLNAEKLLQCLKLTPYLQEFLAQEYIDDDLDANVLRTLLTEIPSMRAIDFCGCSSTAFKDAFASLSSWEWPATLGLKRVSFHKCRRLPASVYEIILPKLPGLTHLDVAGTQINDTALWSIPRTARITHLNLALCKKLSASKVIEFLTTHDSVKDSLVFLSLAIDARTDRLYDEAHIAQLLRGLPKTVKSLNLKGSRMEEEHIKLLLPHTKRLEELAFGWGMRLQDVDSLFIPDSSLSLEEQMAWVPPALKFIDITEVDWDLLGLYNDSLLLKSHSAPLEVIEIDDDVSKKLKKSPAAMKRSGWRLSELHARSWLARDTEPERARDNGRRTWKMGASFWGMRKVPVAQAEVGGMYGSYMFGRAF